MTKIAVTLCGVTKRYAGVGAVLEAFDLTVQQGDFFVLYGPSASGKTTLLNIVAGIESPDAGTVLCRGKNERRKIAYLFQNYEQTLFPWLTNASNIAMPLNMNRHSLMPTSERRSKVEKTVKQLGLEMPLDMHPYEMSGGGKQKVALARAFVADPDILLLDEPFNSLDIKDRDVMRAEIVRLWQETAVTVIFVTHDLDEALLVGNRLAVLGDRPARLMASPLPIGLPYPRTSYVLASREFIELRQKALTLFEEGKQKLGQKVQTNAE